jgi:muramoyltetrapeptide carboxypeptidase LdcA involved in peptidoglycan recycling
MVTQLRQSGILARAAAVVIGELPNCDEPSGDADGASVMADLFADFPGPVLIGFPRPHDGPAMTLPFGVRRGSWPARSRDSSSKKPQCA